MNSGGNTERLIRVRRHSVDHSRTVQHLHRADRVSRKLICVPEHYRLAYLWEFLAREVCVARQYHRQILARYRRVRRESVASHSLHDFALLRPCYVWRGYRNLYKIYGMAGK